MQGKGLIKFFLGLMLLVCVYQFSLYIPTNRVEKDAEAANMVNGEVDRDGYRAYLDSISSEDIMTIPGIASFTYNELKGQQLAQGLDLKGGMSLVLQVDLKDFLFKLSNENKDETFLLALDNAEKALKTSQSDFITIFADEYQKVANGKTLGNIFIKNQSLRDDIQFDTPDGEVISLARAKADETVQLTFDRLKERIDKTGVVQPNISLDRERDLIIVELPGIDNPERARILVSKAAKLEFWRVYRASDAGITQGLIAADDQLKATLGADDSEQEREILSINNNYASTTDADGNVTVDSSVITSVDTVYADAPFVGGPLLSLLQPSGPVQSAIIGTAKGNTRNTISRYLEDPTVKALFPADLMFKWGKDPIRNLEGVKTTDYYLYAIKKDRGRDGAPLEGDKVIDASAQPDPTTGKIQVSLEMDNKGAQIWGQMTTEAANDANREIAIVLDDEVVSAPRVNGPILGGNSSISGDYTIQEAQDLANILKVGKLPADINIIQEKIVGPTLGAENIARSQWSLIIGLGLVLLFMLVYYSGAGIVSIIALVLNIVFIFAALASYGTVLTLPGFAGIVLTIGMAVDANVIIFERIREELRAGKSTAMAIADGFNFSYSAIIDANVTTIITALVLAKFGLGPIKGFAVVLIIGVLASLFTAVLVGRLIFSWWETKGKDISFSTGLSKGAFANLNIDWLGKRKITYVISGVFVLLGIYALATSSFDLGVDFKGGYSYNVALDEGQTLNREDVAAALDASFGSPTTVKAVDGGRSFDITTSYGVDMTEDNVDELVMSKLHAGINGLVGGNLDIEQFKNPTGKGAHVESSYKIGSTIADDIRASSFKAGVFALLLIFLYIFIRFSKWQYSLGAVAALFHDVLIVLAVFSFGRYIFGFPLEIDQNFIAAILTVIGYSINDTVVVFDRIREFMGEYSNRTKEEIINLAINNTISRTIITSLTTLFVVAVLFFFGGESTKGLAFALLVGILVGTYSSVFVATPLMSDFSGELKTKESAADSKKRFSKAAKA